MRVLPVSSYNSADSYGKNANFKASFVVSRDAATHASSQIRNKTNMAYLLLYDSVHKLNERIKNEYPAGTTFTLDIIKNKKKVSPSGKNSNYEIRVGDKSVDYYFDFENILHNPEYHGKSDAERIDLESTKQSNYLYDTYKFLSSKLRLHNN